MQLNDKQINKNMKPGTSKEIRLQPELSNCRYSTIAQQNLNKSLLVRDTLFNMKCCQIVARAVLQQCSVAEFKQTDIFCNLGLTTMVTTNNWYHERPNLPMERIPRTCLTSLNSPTTVFSASLFCSSFMGADLPLITSATWATNPLST